MASEHFENYLKSIYAIETDRGKVSTTILSERLRISAASATEMIKKLAEEGLIMHEPYKGVHLTETGKKQALQIVRRHRLWELFLVKVLQYEWDEIHDEAERLEHIASDKLLNRIDEILGYPNRDPHGDPIPSADGKLKRAKLRSLSSVRGGESVKVTRVSDSNAEILQYLQKLGVRLGKKLAVRERMEFDGSFRVEIDGKKQFISAKLAQHIYVE
jgi:DtxR family Mn-dependent transcriptional regulator